MGPCTNAKYPNFFPNLTHQKIILIVFNNYSIFFRLDVLSFNLKSNGIKSHD